MERGKLMDIAKRVAMFRQKKKISVYKLAQLSGISATYLYEIELGKKQPTVEVISRICEALEISLANFFSEDQSQIASLLPLKYKLVKKISALSEESIKYLEQQADLLKIKESLNESGDKD